MTNTPDHSPDEAERLKKMPGAYRTISEVAEELHIPQHRLRAWETMYPVIKPFRGESGRRYYSPEAIDIIRQISDILYVQGYRGQSVMRVLQERARDRTLDGSALPESIVNAATELDTAQSTRPLADTTLIAKEYAAAGATPTSAQELEDIETAAESTESEAPITHDGVLEETCKRLQSENAWLRAELREILEELQVLRNLLPI